MTPVERLCRLSLLEGTTLLALLLVAVPLKHLAHLPLAVAIIGPIHGLVFSAYIWAVVEAVAGEGWNRRDALRLTLAAFVPLGSFANVSFLRQKARESRALAG